MSDSLPVAPMKDRQPFYLRPFVHVVALSLLCAAIYANTLDVPFMFDGRVAIKANSSLKLRSLDPEELYDAMFEGQRKRPVGQLTFALNHYFGGDDVAGYHLVNIALHVVNTLLVYAFAMLTLRLVPSNSKRGDPTFDPVTARWMALVAAALFAAHPLQIQAVTYIYQRTVGLATMFYLTSLLLYVQGRLAPSALRRWLFWGGGVLSWALALGSKQIAGILPAVILVYEWYFFRDLDKGWLKRNLIYLLIAGLFIAALAIVYLGHSPMQRILVGYEIRDFTLPERLLTESRVIWFYVSLLVFPHLDRLNLLHDFPVSRSWFEPPTTLFAVLGILALLGLAIRIARTHRLVSFCILWFFLNLVIESTVIGLELVFEHRLYLPMVGTSLLASYLLFASFRGRALPLAAGATAIVLLGATTHFRNEVWRDRVTFWSDVSSKSPGSVRALHNLGVALNAEGRAEEAIEIIRRALATEAKVNPTINRAKSHMQLGKLLQAAGEREEGMAHLEASVRAKPDFAPARNTYGSALAREGRYAEAAKQFAKAIKLKPRYALAHFNFGFTLYIEDNLEGALEHLSKAIEFDPSLADAYYALGLVRREQGRLDEAMQQFSEALRVKPTHASATLDLAMAHLSQGDIDGAIARLSNAVELAPGDARLRYYLALAQSERGDLESACYQLGEAVRIEPGFDDARKGRERCLQALHLRTEAQP